MTVLGNVQAGDKQIEVQRVTKKQKTRRLKTIFHQIFGTLKLSLPSSVYLESTLFNSVDI